MNKTIGNDRLILQYIMPLSEVILDFHDALKRISSGYASFDYEDYDYQVSDVVKVIIIVTLALLARVLSLNYKN